MEVWIITIFGLLTTEPWAILSTIFLKHFKIWSLTANGDTVQAIGTGKLSVVADGDVEDIMQIISLNDVWYGTYVPTKIKTFILYYQARISFRIVFLHHKLHYIIGQSMMIFVRNRQWLLNVAPNKMVLHRERERTEPTSMLRELRARESPSARILGLIIA